MLPTSHTLSAHLNIGVIYIQILVISKLPHHKSYKKKCDFSLMFSLEVTSINYHVDDGKGSKGPQSLTHNQFFYWDVIIAEK